MNEPDPPDLSLWGLHGFCLGARQTPHRSVRADNNGQILYQARTGVTRAQLAAAGVPCLESQITLLNMMGLLSVDGEVLPSTELSVEKPFWNGAFWAIHPARGGGAGTNETVRGEETLVTVWTDKTTDGLRSLSSSWERGEWKQSVPVIRTSENDPLHAACDEIAMAAAAELRALADDLHAEGLTGVTRGELLLIAGHEFIWDVAERLCRLGHVAKPAAMRNDSGAQADLDALSFIRSNGARLQGLD